MFANTKHETRTMIYKNTLNAISPMVFLAWTLNWKYINNISRAINLTLEWTENNIPCLVIFYDNETNKVSKYNNRSFEQQSKVNVNRDGTRQTNVTIWCQVIHKHQPLQRNSSFTYNCNNLNTDSYNLTYNYSVATILQVKQQQL